MQSSKFDCLKVSTQDNWNYGNLKLHGNRMWDPVKLYKRDAAIEREELCCLGSKKLVLVPSPFYHSTFFSAFCFCSSPQIDSFGQWCSAVTQQGKVYIDRARGIRSLADQILAIGCIVFGALVNSYILNKLMANNTTHGVIYVLNKLYLLHRHVHSTL